MYVIISLLVIILPNSTSHLSRHSCDRAKKKSVYPLKNIISHSWEVSEFFFFTVFRNKQSIFGQILMNRLLLQKHIFVLTKYSSFSESAKEHPPQTSEAYFKCCVIKNVWRRKSDIRFILYLISLFISLYFLYDFVILISKYVVHIKFSEKVISKCLWLGTKKMWQFWKHRYGHC